MCFSSLYFAKFMERIDAEKYLSLQILTGNNAHIAAVIAALAVIPHHKYRILRHCHIHQSIGHAAVSYTHLTLPTKLEV